MTDAVTVFLRSWMARALLIAGAVTVMIWGLVRPNGPVIATTAFFVLAFVALGLLDVLVHELSAALADASEDEQEPAAAEDEGPDAEEAAQPEDLAQTDDPFRPRSGWDD